MHSTVSSQQRPRAHRAKVRWDWYILCDGHSAISTCPSVSFMHWPGLTWLYGLDVCSVLDFSLLCIVFVTYCWYYLWAATKVYLCAALSGNHDYDDLSIKLKKIKKGFVKTKKNSLIFMCKYIVYLKLSHATLKILNPRHTVLKGSVQWKLRWVYNGFNLYVWAWDCGAGRFYVVLFRFHLAFIIFPFPVSTAQLIGEFSKTRRSATSDVVLHLLRRYMNFYWRYDARCA